MSAGGVDEGGTYAKNGGNGKPRGKGKGSRLGKRQVAANAAANYGAFLVQIAASFYVSPKLVHGLGDARYGIWSLVDSVLGYLLLLDFGLTASVVRYVSKFEATEDPESRDRVFSTNLCIFAAAGVVAMLIAAAVAGFGLGALRVPEGMRAEARAMFLILGLNLALGLPLSVYPNVLFGLGRYTSSSAIRAAFVVVRSALLVAVVMRGGGLVPLSWVLLATGVAENLAMALAVRRHLPGLRFSPRLVDRATFDSIRGYSLGAFAQSLAQRVAFQTDAIVIGVVLGSAAITPFNIANRLVGYAKTSLRSMTQVLTPAISAMDARGDVEGIRRVMIDGSRYVLWLILPVEVGLIALGRPFLTLWMGPSHAAASYPTLVILSLPLALALAQSISTRILFGTDGLGWLAKATIVHALANLGLSLALARPMGIEGVAWGTTVPYILYNLAVEHHVCRRLGIGAAEFLRGTYLKPLLLAVPLALAWGLAGAWIASWVASTPKAQGWAWMVIVGAAGMAPYALAAALAEFGPSRLAEKLRGRMGGRGKREGGETRGAREADEEARRAEDAEDAERQVTSDK